MTLARIVMALCILAMLMVMISAHDRERDELEGTGWDDADYEDTEETAFWMKVMVDAVVYGDVDDGYTAESHLNGLKYDDISLLSRFMEAMDRPGWAATYRQAAGEVLVNRMNSQEFAGTTIREVLFAQGEDGKAVFPVVMEARWDMLWPGEATVRMAIGLLQGDGIIKDPQAVYIGPKACGGGLAWRVIVGCEGEPTYISRTSRPELYE